METKSFEVFPAPIDNKNIDEDWIYDFMESNGSYINLSNGNNKRLIGCPLDDGNVIECTYTFGDNKITFKAYGEKDSLDEKLLIEKIVAPFLWNDGVFVRLEDAVYRQRVTLSIFHY